MNWTTNILTFKGKRKDEIIKLFDDTTFNNIMPIPDNISNSEDKRKWCDENWGIYREALYVSIRYDDREDGEICIVSFETPMVPPEGILIKLFQMCEEKDVEMQCRYDTEGFGVGTITYKNGELIDDYTLLEDL